MMNENGKFVDSIVDGYLSVKPTGIRYFHFKCVLLFDLSMVCGYRSAHFDVTALFNKHNIRLCKFLDNCILPCLDALCIFYSYVMWQLARN